MSGCSNRGKYKDVPNSMFCGPEGGACPGTYPVNTPKRARAALSYARHAPNPEGIRRCTYRKANQQGWVDPTTGKLKMNGRSPKKSSPKRKDAKAKGKTKVKTVMMGQQEYKVTRRNDKVVVSKA